MKVLDLAEKIKSEIIEDVLAETIPENIASYSALHDYVDANCYGGTEAMLEAMDNAGDQTEESHVANLNAICDIMNEAHNIVDAWIKSGALRSL